MREIKFRGRKIYTGKWVIGNLGYIKDNGHSGILVGGKLHIVDTDTVGEYTGLKDKNGMDVYEGDILRIPEFYETPENTSTTYVNCIVTFENHSFCVGNQPMYEDYEYLSEEAEIIGSVYENSEIETID